MLVYVILILAIILGNSFSKKHKRGYLLLICIIMSLIAGMRHILIGNDTANYLNTFNSALINGSKIFLHSRMESGYLLMNIFFTHFSDSFNLFLFITSLFINASVCLFIFKNSKNVILSLLIFVLLRLFFNEMNILRQYIAISIILHSVKYIKDRNLIKYSLYIILASTFHISAIIAFPIYFLYYKSIKKNTKIILYITCFILFIFLDKILIYITAKLGYYSGYVSTYYNSFELGNILLFIMSLFTYLFCKYIYIKNYNVVLNDKEYQFLLNISFVCMILNFFAIRFSIISRLVEYYYIFIIIILPNFISLIKNNKNRLGAYIFTLFISICYFTIIAYFRPYWNNVIPYRFFWQ